MEKIKKYEAAILDILEFYKKSADEETYFITDLKQHHYQVLQSGWTDEKSFKMWIDLHFHIKPDGKVWILENRTEEDVAKDLVKRGVKKYDIVLGFLPEYARPYSEYAVA